jgi:hypothetical protein
MSASRAGFLLAGGRLGPDGFVGCAAPAEMAPSGSETAALVPHAADTRWLRDSESFDPAALFGALESLNAIPPHHLRAFVRIPYVKQRGKVQ